MTYDKPFEYIVQAALFCGRPFHVDERVYIPNPETEMLAELVLREAPKGGHVVDMGTGSGSIYFKKRKTRLKSYRC
jgi:release factor glutamine methyltransferase